LRFIPSEARTTWQVNRNMPLWILFLLRQAHQILITCFYTAFITASLPYGRLNMASTVAHAFSPILQHMAKTTTSKPIGQTVEQRVENLSHDGPDIFQAFHKSVTSQESTIPQSSGEIAELPGSLPEQEVKRRALLKNLPQLYSQPLLSAFDRKKSALMAQLPKLYAQPKQAAPLKEDPIPNSVSSLAGELPQKSSLSSGNTVPKNARISKIPYELEEMPPETLITDSSTTPQPETSLPTSKTAKVDKAYEQKKQAILAMLQPKFHAPVPQALHKKLPLLEQFNPNAGNTAPSFNMFLNHEPGGVARFLTSPDATYERITID